MALKDVQLWGSWGLELDLQLSIGLSEAGSETTRGTRGVHHLPCRLTPL